MILVMVVGGGKEDTRPYVELEGVGCREMIFLVVYIGKVKLFMSY